MKTITVVYTNMHKLRCQMEMTGRCTYPEQRMVTIDLTDEQIEKLTPQIVGEANGIDRHEEVSNIILI